MNHFLRSTSLALAAVLISGQLAKADCVVIVPGQSIGAFKLGDKWLDLNQLHKITDASLSGSYLIANSGPYRLRFDENKNLAEISMSFLLGDESAVTDSKEPPACFEIAGRKITGKYLFPYLKSALEPCVKSGRRVSDQDSYDCQSGKAGLSASHNYAGSIGVGLPK